MLRQSEMMEYVIVTLSGVAFITHYIYKLGNISAKIHNCEINIEWVRDFLLSRYTNSTNFTQESPIKISGGLQDIISLSWKTILNSANIDVSTCKNAYDCVVCLSKSQGPIKLKARADKLGLEYNDFLLASGIYLYDRKNKKVK